MTLKQIDSNDSVDQVLAKTAVARNWLDVKNPQTYGAPEFTMRVSAHIPGASPAVQDVFVPGFLRLAEMTNGRIQVEQHWGGSLHKERDGIEVLQKGITDMCPVYSAWDANLFPAAQCLSLPFIFPSVELATAVSEDLYDKHFKRDIECHDIYMGRMVATSEYNLFSREPIRTLEDMADQKIACSNGMESDLFSALGAVPVGCSTPEAKQKFESGEVFAISISDSAAYTVGLYKFAKYRTSANLVRVNLEYCLSKSFFNQLPKDLQLTLNAWMRAMAQAGAQIFYGLAGAKACAEFVKAGISFISLTDTEQERWRSRVAHVESALIKNLEGKNYPGAEIIKDIKKQIEKYQDFSSDQLMQATLDQPLMNLLPLK